MKKIFLAFDSVRTYDDNGFLHISSSHITKEGVNPYYGHEIPGSKDLGLDPGKIYYGYRSGQELEKAVDTFNGLPLQLEHHPDSAADPQKEARVGSVGTSAVWARPYIDNALTVTDAAAIKEIEEGAYKELSASYRYDPDFTPGDFEGEAYDFVMRNIRGNHVALVRQGRAGPDVVVADANIKINARSEGMNARRAKKTRALAKIITAMDANPDIEKTEVDLGKALLAVNEIEAGEEGLSKEEIGLDEDKDAKIKEIISRYFQGADPETIKSISDALQELAYSPSERGTDDADPDFAEGVRYGERLEKEEPKKLDREHEREGMKKAMDAVGCDAEDPAQQKAFAEGVKYGERMEKKEPKKLDREHESEGARAAMDAAMIEQTITRKYRELNSAARSVRPLIGEINDPLAFDSAASIYKKALDLSHIPTAGYAPSAYKGMVDILLKTKFEARTPAMDSMPAKLEGDFAALKNVRISGY